jgi:hypothetical protein
LGQLCLGFLSFSICLGKSLLECFLLGLTLSQPLLESFAFGLGLRDLLFDGLNLVVHAGLNLLSFFDYSLLNHLFW